MVQLLPKTEQMKIFITALLSMVLLTTACTKEDKESTENNSYASAKAMMNVSYGTDTSQRMDIYLPANRSTDSTKLIVMIHGGAWAEGDKKDFNDYVATLQARLPKYAIANINYRLATQAVNHFPTQEQDVLAAIMKLMDKRTEYGFSNKVALLGASAGAHLALLQAYKYSNPVKVKAVISFFGPTDMADLYNNPANPYIPFALQILLKGTPTTNATLYQQSSPINFVNAQSPPTLILHGEADGLVPVTQSKTLYNKLQIAGVESQLVLYPNEGHSWVGNNLEDSFNKVVAFLNKHF